MTERKLTEAQQRILAEVAATGERGDRMRDDYSPIARLLELGLVAKSGYAFGSSSYRITDAGRAALEEGR